MLLQEQWQDSKLPVNQNKMNQQTKLKLNIAHLYPELLNIYGDMGNIYALKKRCEWRNIEIEIHNINTGSDINPELFDIYFIGGGQDKQQIDVAKEMQKQKENLKQAAEDNAVMLAICGGYQLLGKYYLPHEGDKLEGIGILNAYTIAGDKRFIGNVTVKSNFLSPETIVGFENHSGLTYLEEGTTPIGTVITGNGNNGKDFTEGARYKNVFGTYLHGSLLPKNPQFTDYLITLALNKKYNCEIELDKLDDTLENIAHKEALTRKY